MRDSQVVAAGWLALPFVAREAFDVLMDETEHRVGGGYDREYDRRVLLRGWEALDTEPALIVAQALGEFAEVFGRLPMWRVVSGSDVSVVCGGCAAVCPPVVGERWERVLVGVCESCWYVTPCRWCGGACVPSDLPCGNGEGVDCSD